MCGFLPGGGLLVLLKQGRGASLPLGYGGAGQGQSSLCQLSHQRESLAITEMGRGDCVSCLPSPIVTGISFTDAPSIGCNFTITTLGEVWCDFEVLVSGKRFLSYNCTQKGICECYISSVPSRATETCNGEEETPKELTEEFKKMLFDTTGKYSTTSSKCARPRADAERVLQGWGAMSL